MVCVSTEGLEPRDLESLGDFQTTNPSHRSHLVTYSIDSGLAIFMHPMASKRQRVQELTETEDSLERPRFASMSDDDSISVETNSFEHTVVTEELLAYYEKIRRERTDGMYLGPPLWPPISPKRPQRRTWRLLVGLQNAYPDHGLKRSPTGGVRSWRLEAKRKQEAASISLVNGAKVQKRKAPGITPPRKVEPRKTLGLTTAKTAQPSDESLLHCKPREE